MKIEVDISKNNLIMIFVAMVILAGIFVVYAQYPASGTGHNADEILMSDGVTTLQDKIDSLEGGAIFKAGGFPIYVSPAAASASTNPVWWDKAVAKEFAVGQGGTIRITYKFTKANPSGLACTAVGINDVALPESYKDSNLYGVEVPVSIDIPVNSGDWVQIYPSTCGTIGNTNVWDLVVSVDHPTPYIYHVK